MSCGYQQHVVAHESYRLSRALGLSGGLLYLPGRCLAGRPSVEPLDRYTRVRHLLSYAWLARQHGLREACVFPKDWFVQWINEIRARVWRADAIQVGLPQRKDNVIEAITKRKK